MHGADGQSEWQEGVLGGRYEGYRTEALEDLYWFSADMPERCSLMHCGGITAILMNTAGSQIHPGCGDESGHSPAGYLFPLPVKLKLLREHTVTSEKDGILPCQRLTAVRDWNGRW